jgi:5-bromo-4-chloroindolyl phosphate hydrolysis protein
MDPEITQIFQFVLRVLPMVVVIVALGVGGSLLHTWLRIRNGYPLQNSWGMAIHPKTDRESLERIKLLTNENAQLRAELGSVKDRLETIERIVTDQPSKLAREIDSLTLEQGGHA